jgi:hypothetical protein
MKFLPSSMALDSALGTSMLMNLIVSVSLGITEIAVGWWAYTLGRKNGNERRIGSLEKGKWAINEAVNFTGKYVLAIGFTLIDVSFCVFGLSWIYLRGKESYWYEWQKGSRQNLTILILHLYQRCFYF